MTAIDTETAAVEAPIFRPRRLGHANLFVSNYERAADFYINVAGFEEVYRQPNNRASFLSNGNTYHDYGLTDINSRYAKPGQKPGLFHLAFEVVNEVELVEGYRKALDEKYEFLMTEDHDVAHSLYKYDPDGNLVEIYADVVPDWRSVRRGIINKEKPKYVPGVTSAPIAEHYYPQDPEIRIVPHAVFHAKKVSHVGMGAQNYEAMVDYYARLVGLEIFAGGPEADFTVFCGTHAKCDLVLYRASDTLAAGLHHVGMAVPSADDLEAGVKKLAERNIELMSDIDHPARRAVTISDPDGIPLRFYIDRDWSAEALAGLDLATARALL